MPVDFCTTTPSRLPDRVAGLLLLLYAQRIATITQLTDDDVHDGNTVAITFGRVPVALPEPLAALVCELVATRKASNIITAPDAKPFPRPPAGQPLGDDRLGQRLQQIGLKPRQDRSTALFALATTLPAAMLAHILGINIKVAVAWQQAASATGPATPPKSTAAQGEARHDSSIHCLAKSSNSDAESG